MDFFVFSNYTLDSLGRVDYPYSTLEGADIIPDITSSMWVERYLEPGEFSFTSPIESQIRTICPIGSIISQVEAQETMIVENHEIVEDQDGQMEVKVSGRSFEVLLENRVIGQTSYMLLEQGTGGHKGSFPPYFSPYAGERFGGGSSDVDIITNTANVWDGGATSPSTVVTIGNFQRISDTVEFLVNRLFGTFEALSPNENALPPAGTLPGLLSLNQPPRHYYVYPNADTINFIVFINPDFKEIPILKTSWNYILEAEDAHTAITKILATESMGIASARAGLTSPIDFQGHGIPHDWPESYKNKLALLVYYGNDRREAVEFSYAGGDISNANYLWSNRNEKNGYLVKGKGLTFLNRGDVGYKQRTMYVDGSDIDRYSWDAGVITGNTFEDWIFKSRDFGKIALAQRENQRTMIMEAQLISQQKDLIYRRDYGTGDLVTVLGNHGFKETMQVIEYIETEDDKGELAYPTLIVPSQKTISDLEKPVGERI